MAMALGGAITAAAPANAEELGTLPVTGFDDVVLDETHGQLFISQGLDAGGVLVTDLNGTTVTELSDLVDSRRLALSFDGATLWVTLPRTGQVVGIDTATLTESSRFTLPAGVCPGSVTEVDGYLAVGHSCNQWARDGQYGGVGVLDPATGGWEPLTFSGPFYRPIVTASPGSQDLFVTGDIGISPTTLFTVTAIDGIPDLVTSRRDTGSNLRDLAMSPDGASVVQASGFPYAHPSFTVPFLGDSVSYESSTYPNAAVWSADGSTLFTGVSTQNGTDVRAHSAGSATTLRSYEFGSQQLADSGLVSASSGSTAYAITRESSGPWRLHILRMPTTTTLDLTGPASTFAGEPVTLTGTLTATDGRPMGGRSVSFVREGTGIAPVSIGARTTAADGSFELTNFPHDPGPTTYRATFAGTAAEASSTAAFTLDVIRKAVSTIVIDAPTSVDEGESIDLTGTLSFDDGRPAGGRDIALFVDSATQYGDPVGATTTDANGSFVFSYSPATLGTHYFSTYYAGDTETQGVRVTTTVDVIADTESTLTIDVPANAELDQLVQVDGQLTISDGVIEPNLEVWLYAQPPAGNYVWSGLVTTDAAGAFTASFIASEAGPITVIAEFDGAGQYTASTATAVIDVVAPPEPTPTSITISAPPNAPVGSTVRLSGQLVDDVGAPLAGRDISVGDVTGGSVSATVITNPNGVWQLDVVMGDEDYVVFDAGFTGDAEHAASNASVFIEIDAPVETTMVLSATEVSGRKNRGKYDLSAVLTPGGASRTVDLYARSDGGPDVLIASGPSTLTLRVDPSTTTTYTARFDGDTGALASSDAVTITVKTKGGGKPRK